MRSDRRTSPRSCRTSASESRRSTRREPDVAPLGVVDPGQRPARGRAREQHAALLEDLADRRGDVHLRLGGRAAEPVCPLGRRRAGPRQAGLAVALVDAATGEDHHARRELHPGDAPEHEDLGPGVPVAHEHHGARAAGLAPRPSARRRASGRPRRRCPAWWSGRTVGSRCRSPPITRRHHDHPITGRRRR